MKRTILFAAAGVALVALASCNPSTLQPEAPDVEPAMGEIAISVVPEEAMVTKAVSAYTTAQTYESQVNSLQLFVFDSDGKINIYKNLGTSTSTSINTTQGAKTVWAVVNASDLSSIQTLDALKESTLDLSANSTTAANGFVMSGSNTCTVGSSAVSCAITVKRLAARVALVSVKNELPASYGALTINRVFLDNVVGNQNIEGTATPTTWYNKEGRADEATRVATHIINGSTYQASCPTLTFKGISQNVASGATYSPSTPDLFYCYANAATAAPNGFVDPFAAQRSVLVIDATVGGTTYYYPVVLSDGTITRNTAHTVAVTITGLGSDDPNKPVEKGSLNVSVTVAGWESGAVYEETI